MKKSLIFLMTLALYSKSFTQNPVTWNYSVIKITDKNYEVHITANIQSGWHLYSQTQPAEAIAIPTSVTFNRHPLVILNGKIKENGKLEKHKEPTLGIVQWQYSEKVDFVQKINLKSNATTNITGNIRFQVCTNEKCLPPADVKFTIRVD